MSVPKLALICLFGLASLVHGAESKVLYKTRFEDKGAAWKGSGKATVSSQARIPKGNSLKIVMEDDADQKSHWLSPAIPNPGKPVIVSFWAADNYLRMTDGSYAATVEVLSYDKTGKKVEETRLFLRAPWDPNRKSSMFGVRTEAGLKWKFYQRSHSPKGATFRLKYLWPKPIVRGSCYLTDVQVLTGTLAEAKVAAKATTAKSRYTLELSSPANGHFYYTDDPLRLDVTPCAWMWFSTPPTRSPSTTTAGCVSTTR
ncbi:MAG: hypothetical protein ACYTGH_22275 [Planctomycetota bacterium]|jgi:hypothetical protein